jgi:hypothetical protein
MDDVTANHPDDQRDGAPTPERHADDAGSSEPEHPAPFSPDSDDESALGDTDQHSDA